MTDYSHSLGISVRNARSRLHMTQHQVADKAEIDSRTVINIEKCKGNPKLEVLGPLIRILQIDPRDIFFPERGKELPALRTLHLLADTCTEREAEALLPVIQSVLSLLRSDETLSVK